MQQFMATSAGEYGACQGFVSHVSISQPMRRSKFLATSSARRPVRHFCTLFRPAKPTEISPDFLTIAEIFFHESGQEDPKEMEQVV